MHLLFMSCACDICQHYLSCLTNIFRIKYKINVCKINCDPIHLTLWHICFRQLQPFGVVIIPNKWAGAIEKVSPSMRRMFGFKSSSCTCVSSHPGFCSHLIHSIVYSDFGSRQRRRWSDRIRAGSLIWAVGVRACPEGIFSLGAAQVISAQLGASGIT